MKSIYIKVSGHIVERGAIMKAQELLRAYDNADIREVRLYIPSLKAGLDERAPSILSFYLTAPDGIIDEIHEAVMNILKENDFFIIHCERCSGGLENW